MSKIWRQSDQNWQFCNIWKTETLFDVMWRKNGTSHVKSVVTYLNGLSTRNILWPVGSIYMIIISKVMTNNVFFLFSCDLDLDLGQFCSMLCNSEIISGLMSCKNIEIIHTILYMLQHYLIQWNGPCFIMGTYSLPWKHMLSSLYHYEILHV